MNHSCSCNPMMLQIQQLGFILVDLTLYLDTHPNCEMALTDYAKVQERLHQLRHEYEKQYGPLSNFGNSKSDGSWKWVDESILWPWENKRG